MSGSISDELEQRLHHIAKWLEDEAPYTAVDQKHLVEHSSEQAYWHHGYMMACADIVSRLQKDQHHSQPQIQRTKLDS
jgi:hypothetical protein